MTERLMLAVRCQGLIPYKDEPDSKLEDKKQSELCRQAMEEFNEMKEVSDN